MASMTIDGREFPFMVGGAILQVVACVIAAVGGPAWMPLAAVGVTSMAGFWSGWLRGAMARLKEPRSLAYLAHVDAAERDAVDAVFEPEHAAESLASAALRLEVALGHAREAAVAHAEGGDYESPVHCAVADCLGAVTDLDHVLDGLPVEEVPRRGGCC